jgi:acetyltransferase-like isoleucine patch superfamily enzyme
MNTINGEFMEVTRLRDLGVTCSGDDVKVHKSVVIIAPERLSLGDHVRIDPFCIVSATGGISIGSYSHISAHCSLIGEGGIEIEDFANVSHGVKIFSASDDTTGQHLVGPTVPQELRKVLKARVHLQRHAGIATGAVLMPGVVVEEGGVVGPLSFVRRRIPAWTVWAGVPARRISARRRDIVELSHSLIGLSREPES